MQSHYQLLLLVVQYWIKVITPIHHLTPHNHTMCNCAPGLQMMQLLVMTPFGDGDHNREGKKFSWNPDFVISKALHNSCSITFFSICSQNFGPSLKSPLQASLPSETRLWLLNNQQFVILTGSIFPTWYLSFFFYTTTISGQEILHLKVRKLCTWLNILHKQRLP